MSNGESFGDGGGKPPLALIAGPTASGKSDLAVRLAQLLEARGRRAVVINADSAQVYADLAVLSARPAAEDMAGIEHRLFGTWDGAQACSAADWAAAARSEIAAAQTVGAVPILVGGTGLYLGTLLDGIAPVPAIDPAIRQTVRAMDPADAWTALQSEDPVRARKLAAGDRSRIARALEVVRSTGRTLSEWQCERVGGISAGIALYPAVLLPPRTELYQRCDRRFAAMVERGALDEVAALRSRELDRDLPVMRAIGVRELGEVLDGTASMEAAIRTGAQATRNYAKRQYTWFTHQPPAEWPRIHKRNYDPHELFVTLLRDEGLT
jgi:tRNA dimethylallyltransferase